MLCPLDIILKIYIYLFFQPKPRRCLDEIFTAIGNTDNITFLYFLRRLHISINNSYSCKNWYLYMQWVNINRNVEVEKGEKYFMLFQLVLLNTKSRYSHVTLATIRSCVKSAKLVRSPERGPPTVSMWNVLINYCFWSSWSETCSNFFLEIVLLLVKNSEIL